MTTVMACGCFDILHAGHVRHLAVARSWGDRLVVALTVDHCVNKGPGRPINTYQLREEVLLGCRYVDMVVPSTGAVDSIRRYKPDVFVKGVDYEGTPALEADRQACAEVGAVLRVTSTEKLGSGDVIRAILARREQLC